MLLKIIILNIITIIMLNGELKSGSSEKLLSKKIFIFGCNGFYSLLLAGFL